MATHHDTTSGMELIAFDGQDEDDSLRNQSSYRQSTATPSTASDGQMLRYLSQSPRNPTIDLERASTCQFDDSGAVPLRRFASILWNPPRKWQDYWKKYHFIEHIVFRLIEIEIACWILHRSIVGDRDAQGSLKTYKAERITSIVILVLPAVSFLLYAIACYRYGQVNSTSPNSALPTQQEGSNAPQLLSEETIVQGSPISIDPPREPEGEIAASSALPFPNQSASVNPWQDVSEDQRANLRRRGPQKMVKDDVQNEFHCLVFEHYFASRLDDTQKSRESLCGKRGGILGVAMSPGFVLDS